MIFGPAGGQRHHRFFDALRGLPVHVIARRTAWLQGRVFTNSFSGLTAPVKVWLGDRDRLVARKEQTRYFASLCRTRPAWEMSLIRGSGHVVLPAVAQRQARLELLNWLKESNGPVREEFAAVDVP
jgi:hypothetical protein